MADPWQRALGELRLAYERLLGALEAHIASGEPTVFHGKLVLAGRTLQTINFDPTNPTIVYQAGGAL